MIGSKRNLHVLRVVLLLVGMGSSLMAQSTAAKAANETAHAPEKGKDTRSLEATQNWIQQQLHTGPRTAYRVTVKSGSGKGNSWQVTSDYRNFQWKDCDLSYEQVHQKNKDTPRVLRFTVPLWDVSSAFYEWNDGAKDGGYLYTPGVPGLNIHTRSKSIRWARPGTSMPTDQVEIQFGREANYKNRIDELARAFVRAANLCVAHAPKIRATGQAPITKPH